MVGFWASRTRWATSISIRTVANRSSPAATKRRTRFREACRDSSIGTVRNPNFSKRYCFETTCCSSHFRFFSRSLLWPSSRVDVLRRVGDESFRVPGQSMRKMAAGHPGGLQVDAPSVDGLRRGSRNEREVLLEDQRAATFREERDRLRVTFSVLDEPSHFRFLSRTCSTGK